MRSLVPRGRQVQLASLCFLVFTAATGLFCGLATHAGALNLSPTPLVASEGHGQFTVAAKNGGASGGGAVVRWVGPGVATQVITAFDPASTGGFSPAGALLQAADGYWYGATANGATATNGSFNLDGLLYRLRDDGTDRTVVHQFLGTLGGEGSGPQGRLLELTMSGQQWLYGATARGGSQNAGTLFRVHPDGSGFGTLVHFDAATSGSGPLGSLTDGGDGYLYGVTATGGSGSGGTLFRVHPDGTGLAVVHAFAAAAGASPLAPVAVQDGEVFGLTRLGGSVNLGVIYRVAVGGSNFSLVHQFTGTTSDGSKPETALLRAADGSFYAATTEGGAHNKGVLFRLSAGLEDFEPVWNFDTASGAVGKPFGPLVQGADGAIYGVGQTGGANGAGGLFRVTVLPVASPGAALVHRRFSLVEDAFDWSGARLDAEARGGHLAVITSPEENTAMLTQLGSLNASYFIGHSDAGHDGIWTSVTGEALGFSNWDSGEPNGGTSENAPELLPGGAWNDLPASVQRGYVLEEEFWAHATVAASFPSGGGAASSFITGLARGLGGPTPVAAGASVSRRGEATVNLSSGNLAINANGEITVNFADPLPAGAQVLGLRMTTTYSTYWPPSNPAVAGGYFRLNGVGIGEFGWTSFGTGGAFVPLDLAFYGTPPSYLSGANNAVVLGSAWNPTTMGPITLTLTYAQLEPTDLVAGWQIQTALTGAQAGDALSLLAVEGLAVGETTVSENGATVATISRPNASSLNLTLANGVQAVTLERLLHALAFGTSSESPLSHARSVTIRLVRSGETEPFLTDARAVNVSTINDLIEMDTPAAVTFTLNAAWDRPAAQVIPLTVSDSEATLDQLTIAATSDNAALFAPAEVQASFVSGAWQVSLRPLAGQFGQATITLLASDPEGADRVVTFSATVHAPPQITAAPAHATVGSGSPVTLSVTATGSGPLAYQWQRNGTPVGGATAATLELPSADVSQAGAYRVQVSNAHGSVLSAPATVSVLSLPSILAGPATLYRPAGQTAKFEVNASGAAPLGYQWFFNGEPADLNALGATANGASLEFSAVSSVAAGAYQVRVTNTVGQVTSSVAFLVVNPTGLTPVAWGDNSRQQGVFGAAWSNVVAVAAGESHTVGLRADGSVVQTGLATGLTPVPENASPAVAVAVGSGHSLALKADGTVVAWGNPSGEQTAVPNGLVNVIQIVAGAGYSAALTASGEVVAWGNGLTTAGEPVRGGLPLLRRLAAGRQSLLGLSRTGALVQLGGNLAPLTPLPTVEGAVQELAVGESHALALTAAGNVVAWGANEHGETTVPALPVGGVGHVAAGWYHSLALLNDGTVRAWGAGATSGDNQWPAFGQAVVPEGLVAFQLAGGSYSTVALRESAPVLTQDLADVHFAAGQDVELAVQAAGTAPLAYAWFREGNGTPLAGATGPTLELSDLGGAASGRYFVVVSNRAGSVSSRHAELIFDEPPTLTAPLALHSSRTNAGVPLVLAGDSPSLQLTVQGTAPLAFFWQRDGALVSQSATPSLALNAITTAQAGAYRVVVSNIFGVVTSAPVAVTVQVAPAITRVTAPLELLVRSPLLLEVVAAGDAPLTYQWSKGVTPIEGATNAALNLPAVTAADAGTYGITVTNPYGQASTNVTVTVLVPPTLANPTAPTTPQDRHVGSSYSLTAQPQGTGPFDYQWFLNGEPIEGATEATYSVPSLTAENEGEYSVRVRSAVDELTSVIDRINVVTGPVITTQPANVQVALGGTAMLSVGASGEGTLAYQWRRRLPDSSVTNLNAFLPTLTLANVTAGDAGTYFVTVTNAAGAVNSANAVVTVVTPPAITAHPVGGTFSVGDQVTLSVEFTGSTPLTVQWFKDEAEIPGAIAPHLALPPVDVRGDLQGSYTARISNAAGAVISTPAVILTRTAPRIAEFGPLQQTVAPGQAITLEVVAFGNGLTAASYRWLHETAELSNPGPTLTIPAATEGHAGFYKVIVSNADGSVESALASVRVADIPVIAADPVGQTVPLGGAFALSVTATGMGPLTYQWTLDGHALAGATGSTYSVAEVAAEQAGAYRVTVGNLNGSVTSAEAEIRLARKPVITQQPKDALVTEGGNATFSVTVDVEAVFAGQTAYQWLEDGKTITGATNAALTLEGVVWRPGGQSLYTVQVTNPSGRVSSSAAVLKVLRPQPLAGSATTRTVQGVTLQPGWNALFLTLLPEQPYIEEALRGVPWSSVWTWKNRRSTVQFIQEMSETEWNRSDWLVRFSPFDSATNARPEVFANSLIKFTRNTPYLIHLDGTNSFQLQFAGEPGYDRPIWAADSYNLTGFAIDPSRGPVTAREFLSASTSLWDGTTGQPRALYRLNADGLWFPVGANDTLNHGEAYWAYAKGANDYVAPLELTLDAGSRVNFGPIVDRRTVVLHNRTASATKVNLTLLPPGDLALTGAAPTNAVTATNVVDAPVPTGVATIVPLTIRQVTLNGNEAVPLPAASEFTVPAGGEVELRLEPVRAQVPPTGWGNLLTFTDQSGTRHQVPVSVETTVADDTSEASVGTSARRVARARVRRSDAPAPSPLRGLWLGRVNLANVSEVNGFEVTKTVTKFVNDEGKETNVVSFQYTAKQGLTAPTPTAAPLELKVLVHIDAAGAARLLSEAYLLFDDRNATTETPGKFVLISDRSRLADFKGVGMRDGQRVGRRLSAVAFKFDGAAAQRGYVNLTGSFVPGGSGIAEFGLSADSPVNPFKHRYHPDHDNLGLDFKTAAPEGSEVYSFTRRVTLALNPLPPGNANLAGTDQLEGTFTEILSGLHRNPIQSSGPLVLQRVSPVGELNPQ